MNPDGSSEDLSLVPSITVRLRRGALVRCSSFVSMISEWAWDFFLEKMAAGGDRRVGSRTSLLSMAVFLRFEVRGAVTTTMDSAAEAAKLVTRKKKLGLCAIFLKAGK